MISDIVNPIAVELDDTARLMRIRWDDGHLGVWGWTDLRRACPCALCAGEGSLPGIVTLDTVFPPDAVTIELPADYASKRIGIDFTEEQVTTSLVDLGATVEKNDGGYRVTGRWPYGSGCQNSDYLAFTTGVHIGDEPRIDRFGLAEQRIVVVPASSATIHDTWRVSGLRGTGSHDISLHDVFVPEAWTMWWTDSAPHAGALYKHRWWLMAHGAQRLGVARAARADDVEAGAVGEPQVRDHQVELGGPDALEARLDRPGALEGVALALEQHADDLGEARVVVDEEDARLHAAGSLISKQAPPSLWLAARISPPSSWTIS